MKLRVEALNENFKDMYKVEELSMEAFDLAPKKIIEMSKDGNMDFLVFYDANTFIGFTVIK